MNVPARLAAFAAGLAVVFAAAAGVGNAVGPTAEPAGPGQHGGHGAGPSPEGDGPGGGGDVAGLSVSEAGYTLVLDASTHPAGSPAAFGFTVTGPDGRPLRSFTPTHDKELHLVVVRRDTGGFQHVHPERDAAGRWTVPLLLPDAGAYKVFADFAPAGRDEAITLAADVSVPGEYAPQPVPPASRTAAVDGYTVTLDGDLVPGQESPLRLRVSRQGSPVTDLQPYLGAYGHLVALRTGDLAYLHVHPDDEPDGPADPGGPDITFSADVPTEGTYRLYLDFRHEGVVRTAEFTAVAARGAPAPAPAQPSVPAGEAPHDAEPHDH